MNDTPKRYYEILLAMRLFQGTFFNDLIGKNKLRMSDDYKQDVSSLTGEQLANNLAVLKRLSEEPLVRERNDPELSSVLDTLHRAHEEFQRLDYALIELAYAPRMRRGVLVYFASEFETLVNSYLVTRERADLTRLIALVESFQTERYGELSKRFRGPALDEAQEFFAALDELWFELTLKSTER